MIKRPILIRALLALLLLSVIPAHAEEEEKGKFSVKIESITRAENKYEMTVTLENVSPGYARLHVQDPRTVGRTTFSSRSGNQITTSAFRDIRCFDINETTVFTMPQKEPRILKFSGESDGKGSIYFQKLDQSLPIHENPAEIRIQFELYVSDFLKKTSYVEEVQSDWVKVDFPFALSQPKEKKEEDPDPAEQEKILPPPILPEPEREKK